MPNDELTRLQMLERKLLTFPDRETCSWAVNSIRVFRDAAERLLKSRYQDGEVDSAALSRFEQDIGRAERADLDGADD